MIADIITRLKSNAPVFSGRVEGAGSFAAMMQSKRLPHVTPAAHIVPVGLQGGKAEAAAGAFTQDTVETFGVIFTVRSSDPVGRDKLEPIDAIKAEVIAALAGWAPSTEVGVFQLVSGSLRNITDGALVYQLDFRISDQLRILS